MIQSIWSVAYSDFERALVAQVVRDTGSSPDLSFTFYHYRLTVTVHTGQYDHRNRKNNDNLVFCLIKVLSLVSSTRF